MSDELKMFIGLTLFLVVIIGAAMAWDWYRCGVQQRVWERQGIHMSRWEIFVGADPAQKTVTIQNGPQP